MKVDDECKRLQAEIDATWNRAVYACSAECLIPAERGNASWGGRDCIEVRNAILELLKPPKGAEQ